MADYFTHFSCLLDVGTAENARIALDLYNSLSEDTEQDFRPSDGFNLAIDPSSPTQLWIYDDCSGDPEIVIQFVLNCAERLDLKGLWGFEYANTCSKARVDAFGGGAHIIDLGARQSIGWISTNEWLTEALSGDLADV
ncbi:hypothetical protein [Asticcacaulis tiandongensis]|uniref:hypothetical protein n=1 Tax=Asticcacaulis tiandongensis TaxID=2565365 RepID=UPI00112A62D7|nr:hypothetical protein [Asticcacaulis tiandongensis]